MLQPLHRWEKNPTTRGTEGQMGLKAGLGNEPLIIQPAAQSIY